LSNIESICSTNRTSSGYNVSQYNLTVNLTRGETVGWAFWGNDSSNNWNYTGVQSFVMNNSEPNISSVILNTTDISLNDTNHNLTGYVTSSDGDSDNITYAYTWYRNGTLNASSLITSGLVSYWPLDNDTLDYYGGNDGVARGNAYRNTTSYAIGGSYGFDGVDDYVDLDAGVSSFASDTEGSISLWVKRAEVGEAQLLVTASDKSDASSDFTLFFHSTNQAKLSIREGGSSRLLFGSTINNITDSNWHHIVVIVDTSGSNLYIDGSEEVILYDTGDSSTQAWFNNVSDLDSLRIGNREDSGGDEFHFNGTIDEVMIFNRSLNATEISQLYWAGFRSGHTMNSSQTSANDTWILGVKAGDYLDWGSEVNSSALLVQANTAPNTALVVLNSTDISLNDTNQNLTCYANITDANGGNVYANYTWHNNSNEVLSGQSAAFTQNTISLIATLGFANTTRNDNWTCQVKGYDGTSYETDAVNSSNVTILSNVPAVTSVVLNSTDVSLNDTNQNLTGYVSAETDFGRNITYAYNWYKNNSLNATSLITDSLVSYWPLDNDTLDYYGGNDGVNNDGAVQNKTSYAVGGSYGLDGSNDYIDMNKSKE